jgi:GPI ethanolamine phosphate transferase 1
MVRSSSCLPRRTECGECTRIHSGGSITLRAEMSSRRISRLLWYTHSNLSQRGAHTAQAALVGVPFPMNSVGRLPYQYLHAADSFKTRKLLENSEQIAQQLRRKSRKKCPRDQDVVADREIEMRKERSSFFRPFGGSQRVEDLLATARYLLNAEDHLPAREAIAEAMEVTEAGLQYFQTYDWALLMSAITAGYLGWIAYVVLFFAERHTHSVAPVRSHNISHLFILLGSHQIGGCIRWSCPRCSRCTC